MQRINTELYIHQKIDAEGVARVVITSDDCDWMLNILKQHEVKYFVESQNVEVKINDKKFITHVINIGSSSIYNIYNK